ncbi:MAG: Mrp/NBP35 family ATP-binding protein [Candidatus Aerophobetes bacterium]|nr:Mrp/NBP35 family ATP-binding protein [Candidatus Aerophobetes bacterium]
MKQTGAPSQQDKQKEQIKERMDIIKHKLIIVSGKGGVGKSAVAVNLAYSLLFQSKEVGILDVDIHGPSLAKMLGIENLRLGASQKDTVEPIPVTPHLKAVTIASLLESSDTPVIWRGPLKMKLIAQFLGNVNWSSLDYLIIDSPPGTGDEPLSVAQLIPGMDGMIIVTTPQDVALLDSRKSIGFAKALKVPVIGIIENMSGLICPHCGGKIDLFKTGGGERAAENLKVPFLGRIPIEPTIVDSTDEGKPFVQNYKETETAKVMDRIAMKIMQRVKNKNQQ